MSIPVLKIAQKVPAESVLVIGAVAAKNSVSLVTSSDVKVLERHVKDLDISATLDSFTKVVDPGNPKRMIAIVGLGSDARSLNNIRYAAGVAARRLAGTSSIAIDFDSTSTESTAVALEGAALGTYSFDSYKSKPSSQQPVKTVTAIGKISPDQAKKIVSATSTTVAAIKLVKDLVNTPAKDLYPETFVEATLEHIKGLAIKAQVWDVPRLTKDGFGGILGVGLGSSRPPRLVKLSYSPRGAQSHVALIGKGITFDTGGLSLKSGAGMIGMKYDMTGAATALAVMRALAEKKVKLQVTAWLCLAENMPSGHAIRPNDVLVIHGGTTVEVLNTDAEGRLVLADGLVAASAEKPDLLIDIATLTGAATIALGTRHTGAMGDAEQISRLMEAGRNEGENIWHMPLPDEMRSLLNSEVADIANVKPGNTAGGMLVAATFLKEFVGRTGTDVDSPPIPWIHLDIASTANNGGSPYGFTGVGPTGTVVRPLISYLESYAQA